MPAGLTGWAQVHGLNGDTSITDRARFDNSYIEYWSFWLDLVILARTVTSVAAEAAGASRTRAPAPGRSSMKVLHVITGLGVGGAELQLPLDPAAHPARVRRGHAVQPGPGRGHDPRRRRAGCATWG